VALKKGSIVVNSQGGGSKDTIKQNKICLEE
jgi:hypothetical protein